MDLETGLCMLPEYQHEVFKNDVYWWQWYYRDWQAPEGEQCAPESGWPEEWAVEMAFRNMRGEDVRLRSANILDATQAKGYRTRADHWCRGYYYCLRCYGD